MLDRTTSTFPTPVAVATGGKIVLVSTANNQITVSRLMPNGVPDPSFDSDGQAVIVPPSGGSISAAAVAIQPDGKIVVAGTLQTTPPGEDAMVWRLKAEGDVGNQPNGALDPTFDTDGQAQLDSGGFDTGNAVAIQPDGKIVVAGTSLIMPNPTQASVWRLKAGGGTGAINGALDPTFDTDGAAGISDTGIDQITSMALQSDGKILIAGTTDMAGTPLDAVVWRLKANGGTGALNGARDATFDTDGQANFDNGGSERAQGIAVAPDGKIVLSGSSTIGATTTALVWRVKPDGGDGVTNHALDPTFDTDGVATINGGGTTAGAEGVALAPDGKILVAGFSLAGTSGAADVWRLSPNGGSGAVNGALDPTFASGGAAQFAGTAGASASGLALGPDRRIVASGATFGENLFAMRVLGDPFTLKVVLAGSGSGTVVGPGTAINCGAVCSAPVDDGQVVGLAETHSAGTFDGWSGAGCSGTASCAVTMTSDQTVTAAFTAAPATTATTTTGTTGTTPPPKKHFSLRSSSLSMKAFKRSARHATATIKKLPAGAKLRASLLAGRTTVARATATASKAGNAHVTFRFSKATRRRLHARTLKRLTLSVTVTPKGDRASTATRHVSLKRG